jgi:nicotinamidase-related amidase
VDVDADAGERPLAVLAIDFIPTTVSRYTFDGTACVARAAQVAAAARAAGCSVWHVVPARFLRESGAVGWSENAFHELARPAPEDQVFYKSRVGAFSSPDMRAALDEHGRGPLWITGISTAGTVLSTVRAAFDADWPVSVVADACSDPDRDVHDLLTAAAHGASWLSLRRYARVIDTASAVASLAAPAR